MGRTYRPSTDILRPRTRKKRIKSSIPHILDFRFRFASAEIVFPLSWTSITLALFASECIGGDDSFGEFPVFALASLDYVSYYALELF